MECDKDKVVAGREGKIYFPKNINEITKFTTQI